MSAPTHREKAVEHLRLARVELIEDGLQGADHAVTMRAYGELMAFCQRHGLMADDDAQAPTPRLRSVA